MSENTSFNFITVSSDAEDTVAGSSSRDSDMVIHAGVTDGHASAEQDASVDVDFGVDAHVDRDLSTSADAEVLDVEPMPLVQRIVIVLAVVCLIGAIVYCTLFMR